MIGAYLLIGGHAALIAVLKVFEDKDLMDVPWELVKFGIMAEAGYGLWILMNKLSFLL